MAERPSTADVVAAAAAEIDQADGLEQTLTKIVEVATAALDCVDHAGIALLDGRHEIVARAQTSDLVDELDALQYRLRQGPAAEALHGASPSVLANRLHHEQRWPGYVPRAVKLGVRAQIGLKLSRRRETQGVLNLYSTEVEELDPQVRQLAELFARHAALALGRARAEADLRAVLQTRRMIGQATGIVMERYRLDEDRAFGYLARVSQNENVKLRDVAQDVVDRANLEHGGGTSPRPDQIGG